MNTVGHHGTTDIDALALAVRDTESRRLIGEAISAYRGGALRSAIVSTWIAVAYDIIAKARELATQGEAAPQGFVTELDDAIDADDKRRLQTFEAELVTKADRDLQLLAPHEVDALVRLQRDRHLCAHPAFVVEDELYQPSPELVRAHIVHALQYLLVHAPLQGKSAIARFDADLLSPIFPATPEEIGNFLCAKYLDRAKPVLVVNLIKAIISAPFGAENAKYAGKIRTLALTLREIANAKTQIYDRIVPAYVAQKFDSVADDTLLRICPFLANDERIWGWLREPERIRTRRLLETAGTEALKSCCAFDAIVADPVSEILSDRFDTFEKAEQISIIAEHPSKEFVNKGIELYSDAVGYRHAEELGRSVILSLAEYFDSADVEAVLKAASENEQILNAHGMPDILEQLFDQTTSFLSESRPHWEDFVRGQIDHADGDFSDRYRYPGLQKRLDWNAEKT